MSELVQCESIIVSLVFKCPHCGHMNILSRDVMPLASTIVNDEVELYYLEPCHDCRHECKVGVAAISQ